MTCRSLQQLEMLFSFLSSITVPNSILAENISLTLEPSVVHIHIDVSSHPFILWQLLMLEYSS